MQEKFLSKEYGEKALDQISKSLKIIEDHVVEIKVETAVQKDQIRTISTTLKEHTTAEEESYSKINKKLYDLNNDSIKTKLFYSSMGLIISVMVYFNTQLSDLTEKVAVFQNKSTIYTSNE